METSSQCTRCGQPGEFYRDVSKPRGHGTICKECVKAKRRESYAVDPTRQKANNRRYWLTHKDQFTERARQLRRDTLDAYGGACACCGETTPQFLGVDHVHNDGEAHRREMAGYGRAIYRWLKNAGYPQDGRFQLLCHNCNMAKGLYGRCPHQT